MIIELDNPLHVTQVTHMAGEMGYEVPHFRLLLCKSISNPDEIVVVSKKKNSQVIDGFIQAAEEIVDDERAVFIKLSYISASAPRETGHNLINRVRAWAMERGIEYLYMLTTRNIHAFRRKYKFEFVSHLLRRKVANDPENKKLDSQAIPARVSLPI